MIGLIAFTTKLLTGGNDNSTANAAASTQTVSATNTGKKAQTTTVAAAEPANGNASVQSVPKVQGLPAPRYQSGATAMVHQPVLAAASWVALDVDRNEIILAHGERDKRPIASLTKMMTGLLTSEAGDLAHAVTVSSTANNV